MLNRSSKSKGPRNTKRAKSVADIAAGDVLKAIENIEKFRSENEDKLKRSKRPYTSGKTPEPYRWDQDGIKHKRA